MSVIAIRADAWSAMTDVQRAGLIDAAELPILGEPAPHVEGATTWNVYDDPRITEDQVAVVAAMMEHPDAIPLPEVETP